MSPSTARRGKPSLPHTSLRVGGWLPHNRSAIIAFIERLKAKVPTDAETPLLPPVQALRDLIESDPYIYAGATRMISEVPSKYTRDPSGGPRLTDYVHMCQLINAAISEPPIYSDTELVAFPINAILDWSMGTQSGTHWFLNEKVNKCFMEILRYWGEYLSSKRSLNAFSPIEQGGGGWSSPEAEAKVDMSQYEQPDSKAPGWGYDSWNSWFIRKFKEGQRPVADPDNDHIIVNACESTPFARQTNVQLFSNFWVKGQPYSLKFMLNNDERAKLFIGGTVYQAFLNAFNYHRWHSPVSGVVRSTELVSGSYYAEALSQGFDESGPNLSQGYITHHAARAIIFIEADNTSIGLMAFVSVGMAEVSSNVVTVEAGQRVKKGDELGYFQFGGSTHCLIFAKDVISEWSGASEPQPDAEVVPLGAYLATARCRIATARNR